MSVQGSDSDVFEENKEIEQESSDSDSSESEAVVSQTNKTITFDQEF